MRLKKPQFMNLFALVVASFVLAWTEPAGAEPEASVDASERNGFRTWTDSSGIFHEVAAFVESKNGKVSLKKRDGKTITVSMESLSEADQEYVRVCNMKPRGEGETNGGSVDPAADAGIRQDDGTSALAAQDTAADDDDSVRTESRGSETVKSKPRTLARTTARTAARTTVRSFDDRGTRQVVVDGVGATAEEAIKDCFRKAVSTVMGTIINAETDVENDRLVMDRILTLSDGYVDTYEELGGARVEDGLVRRRISATVRRDSLLLACGRAESMSVDASGLYPEAMTKLERRKSAQALLRATLDLFPGKLLDLQLEGRPPITKLGETTTTVAPSLVIRVDAKKYDAVQDRLIQILKCLSKQDGSVSVITPVLPPGWQPEGRQILRREFLGMTDQDPHALSKVEVDFGSIRALTMKKVDALSDNASSAPEPRPVIVRRAPMAYRRHRPPTRTTPARTPAPNRRQEHASPEEEVGTVVLIYGQAGWKWFKLDDCIELPPLSTTVAIRFRNSEGSEIEVATLTLGPWAPGLAAPPGHKTSGVPRTVFVSPSFLYYSGEGYHIPGIIVAKSMTVHGEVTLENDKLARAKTIDAGIRHEP
jgi:hypothetical protein